ncbi:hypothetical protein [Streptomyces sp. NPDC088785]|uniref:hypothetical protein n=1 Tax=Streptomyces sp. NPDC088785 TaxID=3365897 RepID=UPI00381AC78C
MGDSTAPEDARGRALPGQPLSAAAVDLYGRLATGRPTGPEDGEALAQLQAWGMVGVPEDGARPVPLPPTSAAWAVARDALAHLRDQSRMLMELPHAVEQLDLAFSQSRTRAPGTAGSEFLSDRVEVNERIGAILASARAELLGAHPHGPRTREQMDLGVPRDTAALERGVHYRTLYQDAVRDDVVTCEWASTMAPRGVHFRTLADPFERVIIVDERVAVISDYVVPDAPEGAAWIITDRAMVAFCKHAFEQEWRRASPWHGQRRVRGQSPEGGLLSQLQRAILRALSEGETQDGAARRLQVSTRKLQRELDLVRAAWALPQATVAQLTFRWATSPEREATREKAAWRRSLAPGGEGGLPVNRPATPARPSSAP